MRGGLNAGSIAVRAMQSVRSMASWTRSECPTGSMGKRLAKKLDERQGSQGGIYRSFLLPGETAGKSMRFIYPFFWVLTFGS
jgi:hypothetical protein